MPALTEQDEAYLTHVLSITATKLETIYVEAMAALERYSGKPKDQTNENAQTEVVEAITIEGTPCVITRQVCAITEVLSTRSLPAIRNPNKS